jgi:hypothetical protein
VRRPAVCKQLAAARDVVGEAETRALQFRHAGVDLEHVVEARRTEVADARLQDERLEALVADRLIAAGELRQVCDPRRFEPDEVVRVVRDPLRVGFGKPHAHVDREPRPLHPPHSTRLESYRSGAIASSCCAVT